MHNIDVADKLPYQIKVIFWYIEAIFQKCFWKTVQSPDLLTNPQNIRFLTVAFQSAPNLEAFRNANFTINTASYT